MDILAEIVAVKRNEVKKLRSKYSYSNFGDFPYFGRKALSMAKALTADLDLAIIAEVKKASPSAGVIRADFDHRRIADIYHEHGANAISVLTDVRFFQGNITYLSDIARDREVPLLRKDFIIDESQIFEAKAQGADCVLLICEILSAGQLADLSHAAYETGLEVLTEIHSKEQLSKIDFNLNRIIGVNNRDLTSFKVDIDTTLRLAEKIPEETILVSESGLKQKSDFEQLLSAPVNAVLVGEQLMRSEDIGNELKKCKEWCHRAR